MPEIEHLLAEPSANQEETAPPLPEVAIAQAGDLWLLGEHRVLCGDETSPEAVNRLLGGRQPRLLVTDPVLTGNSICPDCSSLRAGTVMSCAEDAECILVARLRLA